MTSQHTGNMYTQKIICILSGILCSFLFVCYSQAADRLIVIDHSVTRPFDGASSVHAADMDGDGDMDVLGAAYSADDITWWENTAGDGTAWTEHIIGELEIALNINGSVFVVSSILLLAAVVSTDLFSIFLQNI